MYKSVLFLILHVKQAAMKWLLFIMLGLALFSCKKKKYIAYDNKNYKKARICRESNSTDSAFYYYNLAKNDYLKTNDSLGIGKSLVNMAMIQTNKGDFFGGIESSLEANKYLKKEKDSTIRSTLATNYNNIALAFHFLKSFDKSFDFYFKALTYIENEDDKLLCYNNIGDVLVTQGNFKLAKKYLQKALLTNSSINYSKALNNLAKAKYLDDENYDPLPELYQALEIREKNKDELGKNSSFETLSEYFAKKDKSLSLSFAKKMFETAVNTKRPSDQILALQKIIILDPQNYLTNFQKFVSINSDLQTERNKAKNQFAFVRYDLEGKRAENEILKAESLKKNFGLLTLSVLLVGGGLWYRKRKIRLQQEKELEVKNTELKMSKKVHDVVANGIYQVMTKIENQESFDKEKALDELEFVYEKSRDISYDKLDQMGSPKDYKEKISNLIASFKNDDTETYTVGNEDEIWTGLPQSHFEEIYQVIRELLVNMKKHSRASRVVFKFERFENQVEIHYTDNGIGIPSDIIHKNGLTNTVSRMAAIHGAIIFDTKTEKGLKINISFPVS